MSFRRDAPEPLSGEEVAMLRRYYECKIQKACDAFSLPTKAGLYWEQALDRPPPPRVCLYEHSTNVSSPPPPRVCTST